MTAPAGPRYKLVVAHPERKAQRSLRRLAGATLCPVTVVTDLEALVASVDASTIAVVDTGLALAQPALATLPARAWIAVPGEGLAPAEAETVTTLLGHGWDHVISHPMPMLGEELLATAQKLIRGDVFGLEKYLVWGAEVRSFELTDTRERDSLVADLAKEVVSVGLPERVGSLVSVIADELIANAIYAAPVDETGMRVRADERRDTPRALGGRDAVTIRWATDARFLAIEVRDQWGSADLAAMAKRLSLGGKQTGEGGMGLQLAYACCNQFVIGSAPGVRTEVITLLDIRYKPTELGRAASFHAFTADAP